MLSYSDTGLDIVMLLGSTPGVIVDASIAFDIVLIPFSLLHNLAFL